jgi:hypothetical protein
MRLFCSFPTLLVAAVMRSLCHQASASRERIRVLLWLMSKPGGDVAVRGEDLPFLLPWICTRLYFSSALSRSHLASCTGIIVPDHPSWDTRRRFLWEQLRLRKNFVALARLRLQDLISSAVRVLLLLGMALFWPTVLAIVIWMYPAVGHGLLAKLKDLWAWLSWLCRWVLTCLAVPPY